MIYRGILTVLIIAVVAVDLPLKVLWLLTLVNLLVEENFPFSHFPMYSSFSRFTYYIYVTNEYDVPIPMKRVFGIEASFLKKVYDRDVRSGRSRRMRTLTQPELADAGRMALAFLRGRPAPATSNPALYQRLRLYQVNIQLVDKTIQRNRMLIAETE